MTTQQAGSPFASFSPSWKSVLWTAFSIAVLAAGGCGPECTSDADCDDGVFCNGIESCDTDSGSCVAISSCPPTIPPTVCNEETDSCDPAP